MTVLDLGPGRSSTLAFLTEFPTRVIFSDLFDVDVTLAEPDATDAAREEHALAVFNDALGLTRDTQIDVCLMWDYLHYLDRPSLRALSTALRPHLHRNSRGYAFGVLHANTAMDEHDYAIHDIDHLVRQPKTISVAHKPHTQRVLSENFPAFTVIKGTLLREGRLEFYLET